MRLGAIVIITAVVLAVLLIVLVVIATVVLLPPVRRAMAERSARLDADVDRAVSEPEAPNGDRAEPRER